MNQKKIYLAPRGARCPIKTEDGRGIIDEIPDRHVVITTVGALLTRNIWFPGPKGIVLDEEYMVIDADGIIGEMKTALGWIKFSK